jgi:hypothetical protein
MPPEDDPNNNILRRESQRISTSCLSMLIQGGNQEANEGNNENVDPNQPNPPQDQQNPAPQPDVNQQQGD